MHLKTVDRKILGKAIKIAHSFCPTNRDLPTSHFAFLIKSKIIEKIGINKKRTHPETSKHPYHEGYVGIHAELDCLLKTSKEDLRNYKMLVLRIDGNGKLNISKPCHGCQSVLSQFNLKEIWYSDKDGNIIQM